MSLLARTQKILSRLQSAAWPRLAPDDPAHLSGESAEDQTAAGVAASPVQPEVPQPEWAPLLAEKVASVENQSDLKLDWGQLTLSASVALIPDKAGSLSGKVVVIRDYSQEASFQRQKDELFRMIVHDVKTPLVNIDSNLELLAMPITEAQHANLVDRIDLSARYLLRLLDEMDDQEQLRAGQPLPIHMGSVSPAQLLDELLAATSELAKAKHLVLSTCLDPALPARLAGDSQRLLQILINLVGNAIKYTDQGGVVVGLERQDALHWHLTVSDTGRGIPPDALPTIFEPFQQVKASDTRLGSGLGLAIVKHLVVEQMDGVIVVYSEVGQGTSFGILLPLVPATGED